MLLTQMMSSHNMVQILFVYMKCSWVHSGSFPFSYFYNLCYNHISVIIYSAVRIYHLYLFHYFSIYLLPYCTHRDSKTWSTSGIDGVHRFLARVWRLVVGSPSLDGKYNVGTVDLDGEPSLEQLRCLHRCISKVITI